MTFVDTTAPDQGGTLSMEFDLPHPPAKVWRALTDPVLLAEWLLPATGFEPARGASFTFRTQPQPGWDGTVSCVILDVEEPTRLSYSWVVGDALDTVVTFTLAPTPTGTRLNIEQSGFRPEQKRNFGGARYGWRMMGGKLVELLARIP